MSNEYDMGVTPMEEPENTSEIFTPDECSEQPFDPTSEFAEFDSITREVTDMNENPAAALYGLEGEALPEGVSATDYEFTKGDTGVYRSRLLDLNGDGIYETMEITKIGIAGPTAVLYRKDLDGDGRTDREDEFHFRAIPEYDPSANGVRESVHAAERIIRVDSDGDGSFDVKQTQFNEMYAIRDGFNSRYFKPVFSEVRDEATGEWRVVTEAPTTKEQLEQQKADQEKIDLALETTGTPKSIITDTDETADTTESADTGETTDAVETADTTVPEDRNDFIEDEELDEDEDFDEDVEDEELDEDDEYLDEDAEDLEEDDKGEDSDENDEGANLDNNINITDSSTIDTDGDGFDDFGVIRFTADADGDGIQENYYWETYDLDEDGMIDVVMMLSDMDSDGVYESQEAYIFDPTSEEYVRFGPDAYDVTDDQPADTTGSEPIDVIVNEPADTTGAEPTDVTVNEPADITDDGPAGTTDDQPGDNTPVNEPVEIKEPERGTYSYELDQYDPEKSDRTKVTGNPETALEHWEYQGQTARCAIYSQKFIIEEFTGVKIDIEDMVSYAKQQGWFTESGTSPADMNKLLEVYGIESELNFGYTISDIESALANGDRVIVAVDSGEYWMGESEELYTPVDGPDHAVEVVGIDRSDPEHPMVILNDSGDIDGKGEMVPLNVFENAWADSSNLAVIAHRGNQ